MPSLFVVLAPSTMLFTSPTPPPPPYLFIIHSGFVVSTLRPLPWLMAPGSFLCGSEYYAHVSQRPMPGNVNEQCDPLLINLVSAWGKGVPSTLKNWKLTQGPLAMRVCPVHLFVCFFAHTRVVFWFSWCFCLRVDVSVVYKCVPE